MDQYGLPTVTGAAFDTETIETREPYSRDQDTGAVLSRTRHAYCSATGTCKTIFHLLVYDLALHHDFYN